MSDPDPAARPARLRKTAPVPWRRVLIGALILAAVAGVWLTVARRGQSGQAGAVAVRNALRERHYDTAEAAVGRWLRDAPNSAEARLWQTRVALARRQPEQVADGLNRAQALGADRAQLDLLRALAAAFQGRFPEAEPVLRRAFNESKEHDVLVDEALARGYLELYDFPRATMVLKRWVEDAPRDPTPYLWRAEIDYRAKNGPAVLRDYREALRLDPNSAPARLGLAEALRTSHETIEAARWAAEYVALKPDDPAGHLCAGRVAAESGDAEAAVRHFERVIALDPTSSVAHKELGDVRLRRGEVAEALTALDRAKAFAPFDIDVRHSRGIALARLGRPDEARDEQGTATRLRAELQTMLAAQSRLVSAPGDRAARLTVMRWMFDHGRADQGVRWAETLLRDRPGDPDACLALAEHYAQAGQAGLANYYRLQARDAPGP